MSIESLIDEINKAGFVINNLFQSQAFERGKGDWQANLRTPHPVTSFFEFGRASTPEGALEAAFAKTKVTTAVKNDVPVFLTKAHVSAKPSLEDLL